VKSNRAFAPLGLVRFLSSHGLRVGRIISPLRGFDGRDARPPSRFFFLQTLLLQSRVRVLKNRRGLAMVAQFEPVYLMIQVAATHPLGRQLKPQLISLGLRHD
jgi:hypothetical protein